MKKIKTTGLLLSLSIFCMPWILSAAESTVSASALPPQIFALAEAREGGIPGSTYFFSFMRNPVFQTPIFSTKEGADAFITTLTPEQARKVKPSALPRDFLVQSFKMMGGRAAFLLNPTSIAEGGTPIVTDTPVGEGLKDNEEMKRLYQEDQADRMPKAGEPIDWNIVGSRDRARAARVKELHASSLLKSGADYYHAAMIFQHGQLPEDYLLSHEFCIVAVSKGETRAKWLAAASEDRFLMAIGRKQRFGTQLSNPIIVDGNVSDELRAEMNVPTVAQAEELRDKLYPNKASTKPSDPTSAATPTATVPVAPSSGAPQH